MPDTEGDAAASGETANAEENSSSKGKSKGKGDGKGVRGTRIHVRDLSEVMTTEKLRGLFEGYGNILAIEAKANDDGKCRGIGFIVFATKEEATKAIAEADGKEVDGKKMTVVMAEQRDKGKGKDGKGGDAGKGKGKASQQYGYGSYAGAGYGYPGYGYPGYGYGVMPGYGYGGNMMPYGFGYPAMPYGYGSGMYPPAPPAGSQNNASAEATLAYFGDESKSSNRGKDKAKADDAPAKPVAPPPSPDKVFTGTLKYKSNKNGYGFITCAEAMETWKRDTYLETDDMPANVNVGDTLQFNIFLSDKKFHPRAMNVKIQS